MRLKGLSCLSIPRSLNKIAKDEFSMSIPDDPEKRWWVEAAESNPGLVDSFRSVLVAFLAFDRDKTPYVAGTGFIVAAASQFVLVVSAKHVFSEGVLRAQRPTPGHAPSAMFVHPRDRIPSIEPDRLKVMWRSSVTAAMLNAVHNNYNHAFDIASCILVLQQTELITPRVAIPLDIDEPSVGAVVHMVSLDGLQVEEATPPQDSDGKGQIISTTCRVSIRVGVVTAIYPKGFRQYRWPCFTTSIPAEPGMSGGFVYFPRGGVKIAACGVVCADNSMNEARHDFSQCGESVIALAWPALSLRLPLKLPSEQTDPGHTLHEMIHLGHVPPPLGDLNRIRLLETGDGECIIGRVP